MIILLLPMLALAAGLIIFGSLRSNSLHKKLCYVFSKLAEEFNGQVVSKGRIHCFAFKALIGRTMIEVETKQILAGRFYHSNHIIMTATIGKKVEEHTIDFDRAIDLDEMRRLFMSYM